MAHLEGQRDGRFGPETDPPDSPRHFRNEYCVEVFRVSSALIGPTPCMSHRCEQRAVAAAGDHMSGRTRFSTPIVGSTKERQASSVVLSASATPDDNNEVKGKFNFELTLITKISSLGIMLNLT